jgi:diguanylate cyclase (GGDEF)-like protein
MVGSRSSAKPPRTELAHGIPVYLDQLVKILTTDQRDDRVPDSAMLKIATQHGRDLFEQGFTVEQVIRDYGDVCQAVTTLAVEIGAPISAIDFRTFNRCLDDAIAGAVNEYAELKGADTAAALSVAQRDASEARARALHDSLTGLPNRDLFDDRLAHAIAIADRHHWALAVMFLDLNEFKSINDAYGHTAGDATLKTIAQRLQQYGRSEDTVCRNGGDEFLYLLMNPRGRRSIEHIANSMWRTIAQPVAVADAKLAIKPSIGIAIYPEHGVNGDQLIKNADAAMYRAKNHSRGVVFFDRQNTLEFTARSAPDGR